MAKRIWIKPSKLLQDFITLHPESLLTPETANSNRKVNHRLTRKESDISSGCLVENLIMRSVIADHSNTDGCLNLHDIQILYEFIVKENEFRSDNKIYLHEMLEGSEIIFPKTEQLLRNSQLESRRGKLKIQQENKAYAEMTKNVDSFQLKYPEDSVGYQMKQINNELIAVSQVVLSIAAGFIFGFFGLELLIGNLDIGLRLLFGIGCALIIGVAELYFLVNKLKEEPKKDN